MVETYVTGSSGLVGSRFVELFSHKYGLLTPRTSELDITDKDALADFFKRENIEVVINFAAFTDVGEAEKQRGDRQGVCWQVNVEGVRNLVDVFGEDTHIIQISTDMVFPGSAENPGPYEEDHQIHFDAEKLTWYGFANAQAEKEIQEGAGSKTTILRLIYPVRAKFDGKLDYLRKPLKLFDEGTLYSLFDDQQISITYIDEACLALEKIIDESIEGVFHASSTDTTTPFELVSYLIMKARGERDVVERSSLEDFLRENENSVRYPRSGGLKVEKTQKALGTKFSSTKQVVRGLIKQDI